MTKQTENAEETANAQSLDFKKLIPVLVVVFVDILGLTIIIPVLPYFSIQFGATPFVIGLIGASYPVMQFIFVPVLGALSDRFGRKPVLATAQVGTFCSLLILGFSGALWMVFLSRLLDGITGANLATAQSVITDSTDSENRARGLGLIGATFGVGFLIGPVLSALALYVSGNNYAAPAFLASGFALLSVILTVFVLEETLPEEKRGQQSGSNQNSRNLSRLLSFLQHPALGPLFWLSLLLLTIFGSFQLTFAPFTLTKLGLNSLGNTIFFAIFGVISAIIQGGFAGPLSKRFGERKLVLSGLVLFSLGFLLTGFTPTMTVPWYSRDALIEELSQASAIPVSAGDEVAGLDPSQREELENQIDLLPPENSRSGMFGLIFMILALMPVPIGFAIINPNLNSLITKRADPTQIGEVLGVNAAFAALGTASGPLIGGALFQSLGPNSVYLIGGVAGFALLGLMLARLKPDAADD